MYAYCTKIFRENELDIQPNSSTVENYIPRSHQEILGFDKRELDDFETVYELLQTVWNHFSVSIEERFLSTNEFLITELQLAQQNLVFYEGVFSDLKNGEQKNISSDLEGLRGVYNLKCRLFFNFLCARETLFDCWLKLNNFSFLQKELCFFILTLDENLFSLLIYLMRFANR